jgi:hypothetical protein
VNCQYVVSVVQLGLTASATRNSCLEHTHTVKPLRGRASRAVFQSMLNTTTHRFHNPRHLDPVVSRGTYMQVQYAVAYGTGTRLCPSDPGTVHQVHGRQDGSASGLSLLPRFGVDLRPPRAPNSSAGNLARKVDKLAHALKWTAFEWTLAASPANFVMVSVGP